MSRQFTSGPGDRVVVKGDGILVNGQPIEHSARLAVDGAGRPMPPLPTAGAVPTGYVWLFSDHAPETLRSRAALSTWIGNHANGG